MKLLNWLTGPRWASAGTDLDPSLYPKLIVPTRNRPTSLKCMLGYVAQFYPNASVIVADGSNESFRTQNEAICHALDGKLDLDYRPFDPEISLIARNYAVLESLPEGFYAMGADDDYPVLEILGAAKRFLEQNSDYSICGGHNLKLYETAKGEIRERAFKSQSIQQETVAKRSLAYLEIDFATYYCVTSRSHLLSRFDRVSECHIHGFGDSMVGLHDLMKGKLKILDDLAFIRTSNKTHSYLGSKSRLNFLLDADEILVLKSQVQRDLCAADKQISADEAEKISEEFIVRRIRHIVRDRDPQSKKPFSSDVFFEQMKDKNSPQAKIYGERIRFVKEQLKSIQGSNDNKGEEKLRRSFDG